MRSALIRFARRVRDTRFGYFLQKLYHRPVVYVLFSRFFKLNFGFTAVVGLEPTRAEDRGPAPEVSEEELKAAYRKRRAAADLPDFQADPSDPATPSTGNAPAERESEAGTVVEGQSSFVLYRIIGNDIVPRHRKGQSRDNLQFLLEHEPELPGCEKRWVVNRIVDAGEEQAVIALLEEYDQPYLHIPYREEAYADCRWDMEGLPEAGYTCSRQFAELPEDFRGRLFKRLYRHKNNYVINNNGARNAALADGKKRAEWVLPWDGNCFITESAWAEIVEAVSRKPWYPYIIVPMARVTSYDALLQPDFRPKADQEPQIIFRRDSRESFNEAYYYGRRPKVELLWRLGVPGPWDTWAIEPWDLPYTDYCPDAGAWIKAGWVARLPSGKAHLDAGRGSETRRLGVRAEALTQFLQGLDGEILTDRYSRRKAEASKQGDLPLPAQLPIPPQPPLWISWDAAALLKACRKYCSAASVLKDQKTDPDPNKGPQRHGFSWRRAARRIFSTKRSRTEALRQLLSAYQDIPLHLDRYTRDDLDQTLNEILVILQTDAGVMRFRQDAADGVLVDLFIIAIAFKLKRFGILSHEFLFVSDRAAAVQENKLTDSANLHIWRKIGMYAEQCGYNLFQDTNLQNTEIGRILYSSKGEPAADRASAVKAAPDTSYTDDMAAERAESVPLTRKKPAVVHISTVHRAIDPRIRLKQLRTIMNYGFAAYLVTADPAADPSAGSTADPAASRESSSRKSQEAESNAYASAVNQRHDISRRHDAAAGNYAECADGVRVLSIADREHGRWRRVCITAPLAIWKGLRTPAEIYHFHDPELLPWAWLLLLRRVPVIYDVHEDYSLALNQKFYLPMRLRRLGSAGIGKLEKAFAAPFSIIIAEHCYKKRFPKSREILNYPSRELVERGDALDPSSTHLLYTGNITIERGVLNLVRLVRELPEIELILAGECKVPVLEKIRELVGSAADRLHIVGEGRFVPFEEIQALYAEKRWLAGIVLISESEHYREKQLTKFFEYMAAGLPIIASDFPAWRKLIEDQGVGFCVDPEDMGEVKKTIRYLREHQDETREMGRKGRNLVKNKYSWELEGEHLISLYRGSRIK